MCVDMCQSLKSMRALACFGILLLGAGFSVTDVAAQTTPSARSGAAQVTEARRLLRDPDANVRTAAMETYAFSDNMALREMALDEGFNSADAVIRSLALIGRLHSVNSLVFEVVNAKNLPSDEWAKILTAAKVGPQFVVSQFRLDSKTGQITHYGGHGRLAGQSISIVFRDYVISARLADGGVLLGTVTSGVLSFPIRASLQ